MEYEGVDTLYGTTFVFYFYFCFCCYETMYNGGGAKSEN